MSDVLRQLSALKRPRLLIRAARLGLSDYSRTRDLKRILKTDTPPSPAGALDRLVAQEADAEDRRTNQSAAYNYARHIDILIAIMAETRLLTEPARP